MQIYMKRRLSIVSISFLLIFTLLFSACGPKNVLKNETESEIESESVIQIEIPVVTEPKTGTDDAPTTVETTTTEKEAATKKSVPTTTAKNKANDTPKPPPRTDAPSNVKKGVESLKVLEVTNAERAKHGLSALRADPRLMDIAAIRAEEITRVWSHTRPNGTQVIDIDYVYGENLFYATGASNPQRAIDGWMTSPSHKANIVNGKYETFGGAYYIGSDNLYYWVQLFGY